MPELAEVALFARDLNKKIGSQKLRRLEYGTDPKWSEKIVGPEVQAILADSIGTTPTFTSSGKGLYLIGRKGYVEVRLGMTGRFQVDEPEEKHWKHIFLVMVLQNGAIWYLDYRRFGKMVPCASIPTTGALGGFRGKEFWLASAQEIMKMVDLTYINWEKKPKISWLLEHGPTTGVGNYLANEACGLLNTSPFTPCKDKEEAAMLLMEAGKVAIASFNSGGNSFAGGYFQMDGEPGEYSALCKFYRAPGIPRHTFRGRPVYSHFLP